MMNDLALGVLQSLFGLQSFRADQRGIIDSILGGRDHLVVKATGFGKSICYQVPGVMSMAPTIVVTPLIALIEDQVAALRHKGVSAGCIHSNMSKSSRIEALERIRVGDMRFIYLSPEMLSSWRVARAVIAAQPKIVVVDEAHCISQWGSDFRPAYGDIGNTLRMIERELGYRLQKLAFTGTATPEVKSDIIAAIGCDDIQVVLGENRRKNLSYRVIPLRSKDQKLIKLVELIQDSPGATIVYFLTIKLLEQASALLLDQNLDFSVYHGKMPAEEKSHTLQAFQSGESNVVLATDAFGMGIDKKDIRCVINVGLPLSLENYIQQTGRAGRDGESAFCTALTSPYDSFMHDFFLVNAYIEPCLPVTIYKILRATGQADYPAKASEMLANVLAPGISATANEVDRAIAALKSMGYLKLRKRDGQWRYFLAESYTLPSEDVFEKINRIAGERSVKMLDYAKQKDTCLQVYMERYLSGGTSSLGPCGMCSNCFGIPMEFGFNEAAIFRCVVETRRRYGVTNLVSILQGSYQTATPGARKFATIPTYGKLSHLGADAIKDILKRMIAANYLSRPEARMATVSDTQKGHARYGEYLRSIVKTKVDRD